MSHLKEERLPETLYHKYKPKSKVSLTVKDKFTGLFNYYKDKVTTNVQKFKRNSIK